VRVILVDDHAVVRDGLRALVSAQPGLEVVGEAGDGDTAWRLACALEPDVVVLDLSMPGGGGAAAAERIARDCPGVRVLALTMHEERGYVSQLLGAGAAGYVLKRTASAELVRAIRAVAAGGTYVDPSLAGALLSGRAHPPGRAGGDPGDAARGLTPARVRCCVWWRSATPTRKSRRPSPSASRRSRPTRPPRWPSSGWPPARPSCARPSRGGGSEAPRPAPGEP
jgi:DNA-binding NarL/FixJ family response regulator